MTTGAGWAMEKERTTRIKESTIGSARGAELSLEGGVRVPGDACTCRPNQGRAVRVQRGRRSVAEGRERREGRGG